MWSFEEVWRSVVALGAVLGLFLTACGSDVASDVVTEVVGESLSVTEDALSPATDAGAGVPTALPHSTSEDDEEAEETHPAGELEDSPPPQIPLDLDEADWEGLIEWNLPTMGGLTFAVPDDVVVLHDADMLMIRQKSDLNTGSSSPAMVIARVYQTPPGVPVTAAGMTTSAIAGIGSAEPNNLTLAFLGEELAGWHFILDDDKGAGPFFSYSAYPAGTAGATSWSPFPLGEIFLADVPGGVLAVGWIGEDDDSLLAARTIFDRVAPTVSMARSFGETQAPVNPADLADSEAPPAAQPKPEGWPAVLSGIGAPIAAGDYSHLGFGTPFTFSVDDDWWVQPNFPGWLVLTGNESAGPGDRGVVFRSGVTALVPVLREGPVGAELPFDLRSFVDNPPENLTVTDSSDVVVGGVSGFRMRFEFDDLVDCAAAAVCEYWLATSYPFPPASIRVGYQYELLHLDGGIDAPATILIETYDDRWFDRAQALLDTIQFEVAEVE